MNLVLMTSNLYFRFSQQCVAEAAIPGRSPEVLQGLANQSHDSSKLGSRCSGQVVTCPTQRPWKLPSELSGLCREVGCQALLVPRALLGSYCVTSWRSASSRLPSEPCVGDCGNPGALNQGHSRSRQHPAELRVSQRTRHDPL